MNVNLHICPNGCKDATFATTAHVTQDWNVDALGGFIECVNECVEVDQGPDDANTWTCNECGAEADLIECVQKEIKLPASEQDPERTVTLYVERCAGTPRAFVQEPGIAGLNKCNVERISTTDYIIQIGEENIFYCK